MEKEFPDHKAVAGKIALEATNILKSFFPDVFCDQRRGYSLAGQNLWMNPHDEHFFIVRPIENANAATFRQAFHGAPQVVVVQFLRGGSLERINLASLRIYAVHHVLDG